ncbi:MAG: HD domain-containing protein [Acutalibacteraceae bacterium]|nr:HD domain-containing protein [Acutalibacteraceae bacterium]
MTERAETTKQQFIEVAKAHIQRKGIDNLLKYLEKTDFFTAPASTKYHSAYEGGLAEHSLKVFDNLCTLVSWKLNNGEDITPETTETCAIIALFHDLSKIGQYEITMKNVKDANGKWTKEEQYIVKKDRKLLLGHAETSIYIIQRFITLTVEEVHAIRWHMGAYDSSAKGGDYDIGQALSKYPIALLTHIADNLATNIDEE